MTIPSLYNVNAKEDNNSDRKEPSHTDTNISTDNTEAYTNPDKESDRLPRQKGLVRANLITVVAALVAVTLAFLLQIPLKIALPIWLSSFIFDAMYTYKNRSYINYELNYLVRYSKALYNTLIFGFLLVFAIEIILLLTISVITAKMDSNQNIKDTVGIFSMLFAVLHISAFIRSYKFVNIKNKTDKQINK